MSTAPRRKPVTKPFILTQPIEKVLAAIHFHRYMAAQDVARLLYSPKSITYVRDILSSLAGGEDFKTNQYLYRFRLPSSSGGSVRIFTLGSKGRDFLANEVGLSVDDWYWRPYKCKHYSYSQVLHNLILTRFLVAAAAWCARQPDFKLIKTHICYELAKSPATVKVANAGKTEKLKVIPDAWIEVEKLKNGEHEHYQAIMLEIDRGSEYRQKYIHHLLSRIAFIKSGAYRNLFETEAVVIAYVTTGDRPEYRETRRKAMCRWTQEVLAELHMENWSNIFRFSSVQFDQLYTTTIFDEPVWYQPNSPTPAPLFTP
jgi:hypothetical protein